MAGFGKLMASVGSNSTSSGFGIGAGRKMYGVRVGTIGGNKQEDGRWEVTFIHNDQGEDVESRYCTYVTTGGGKEYGIAFLPEVGDEVCVAFVNGNPDSPVILGYVHGKDTPPIQKVVVTTDDVEFPIPNQEQGGKNEFRGIVSRSKGHIIFKDSKEDADHMIDIRTTAKAGMTFDDKEGAQRIRIYDHNDHKQWIEIHVDEEQITIQTDRPDGQILIKATTTITMDCKDLVIKASETIKVTSGKTSDWTSTGNLTWKTDATALYESGADTTIQGGPNINLNP